MDRQGDLIHHRNPIDMLDLAAVLRRIFREYVIGGKGTGQGETGELGLRAVTWRQRHWLAHFHTLVTVVKILTPDLAQDALDLSRA